jgi:hypothetical protein
MRLKPRDQRALNLGALVLGPILFFTHGVRPFLNARADLLELLETERASYERELRLVLDSERFPELRRQAERGLEGETARLFEGPNDASAGAALAVFVETSARESEVYLQGVEMLATDSVAGGLTRLRVQFQGMSDLEGTLRFLAAVESGDKLVSVEELRIERREGFALSPPTVARTQPAASPSVALSAPGEADTADAGTGSASASSIPTVLSISAVVAGYAAVPRPIEERVGEPLVARDR